MLEKLTSQTVKEIILGDKNVIGGRYYHYYRHIENSQEIKEIILSSIEIDDPFDFILERDIEYSIRFINVKFNADLVFGNRMRLNDVYFLNCQFKRKLTVEYFHAKRLFFERLNNFVHGFETIDGKIDSLLIDSSQNNVDYIDIKGGDFNEVDLRCSVKKYLRISNVNLFINKLKLSSDKFIAKTIIGPGFFNSIRLSGKIDEEGSITISHVFIRNIQLDNLICEGKLTLFNVKVMPKDMYKSRIDSKVYFEWKDKLTKITPEEKVLIEEVNQKFIGNRLEYVKLENLDKPNQILLFKEKVSHSGLQLTNFNSNNNCSFENVELDLIDNIYIKDTSLRTIRFINSLMLNKSLILNSNSKYEIFNSLMQNAESKGNNKEYLHYQSCTKESLMEDKSLPYSTKISLYIPWFYSDFGRSWTRSLKRTIFLAAICFIFMMNTSHFVPDISISGMKNMYSLIPYFIQFLNPIHSTDFMDDAVNNLKFSNNIGFTIFEGLGRILIGIGIYELIRSFRRVSI